MELEVIIDMVGDYGYIGLFFWLWIGVFGIPIPNELIVMTVGYASSNDILDAVPLFMSTYLGLLAAVTTSFIVGKLAGKTVLVFISKRNKLKLHVERSMALIKRYHVFALVISYFLPGVRSMVPFLFGMSGLSFRKFALISYLTSLTWLTIFFILGNQLGEQLEGMKGIEPQIVGLTSSALAIVLVGYILVKWRKRLKRVSHSQH